MKHAPFTLITMFICGLAFTPATVDANPTIITPIVKGASLCPTWPTCKPTPNEEKPPKKVA